MRAGGLARLERLAELARGHGLDVLLEKPGDTFRLALQTTRARVRAGADWYRIHARMPEVRGSFVEKAAGELAEHLERTPPTTEESRA